jgi:hypothetical protein
MHTQVEYVENQGYPLLLFFSQKDEEGALMGESHLIPVQAIADRMELYGLESVEQTLEYIGREFHNSSVSDTLHGPLQQAYKRVAEAEFEVFQEDGRARGAQGRQTLMAPMTIDSGVRGELEEARDWALNELSMGSLIHTFGAARMLDASRPVEETRPRASEALLASETAIEQAVTLMQERVTLVEAWRVETLVAHAPQIQQHIEQKAGTDAGAL